MIFIGIMLGLYILFGIWLIIDTEVKDREKKRKELNQYLKGESTRFPADLTMNTFSQLNRQIVQSEQSEKSIDSDWPKCLCTKEELFSNRFCSTCPSHKDLYKSNIKSAIKIPETTKQEKSKVFGRK